MFMKVDDLALYWPGQATSKSGHWQSSLNQTWYFVNWRGPDGSRITSEEVLS